jgi:uncharacterized protein YyaL (SSP411 family)
MATQKKSNRLSTETSPYLLQHQYNPVDWYPWGDEAFAKAKAENKLVLVSIGYSACHWCHVMEHESFEDDSVAKVMNDHFVCIKVDREERPDVDQVYMNAVQLMTGRGGWPLNCFTMPDGRPVFGGTYYQKSQWLDILDNLTKTWEEEPAKVNDYAEKLSSGVQQSDLVEVNQGPVEFSRSTLDDAVASWRDKLDFKEGGPNRAPKFPLPNNYQFLLKYAHLTDDQQLKDQVYLTLDKMAYGGIYDQIGGGFSRYSTDALWKAPHFEKMLYDNGQLVTLYAEAYQATKKELYKEVVTETLDWVAREMTAKNGAFYSALDADSEGEEGKFYVWSEDELKEHTGDLFPFVKAYYNVNAKGRWEHGNYILLRDDEKRDVAKKLGISTLELDENVVEVKRRLMSIRDTRIRPGLDDKVLTSWNGLMCKGYVDAYLTFGNRKYLSVALKNAEFIWKEQLREDGGLNHSYKDGRSTINGYLEDYCFTAEAFIALYQATLDEKWLERAKTLADYVRLHFSDELTGMFFFTSDIDPPLIARKTEVDDNVIPASNSSMARVFHTLGTLYDDAEMLEIARRMLNNMKERIPEYGSGYSNWGILMLQEVFPYYEIAVTGENAKGYAAKFRESYVPNMLFLGDETGKSELPLLEYKYVDGELMIYVCVNKSCQLPTSNLTEALQQID